MLETIIHMKLWYALPLIVSVSLVYAATRHERMQPILIHAARAARVDRRFHGDYFRGDLRRRVVAVGTGGSPVPAARAELVLEVDRPCRC